MGEPAKSSNSEAKTETSKPKTGFLSSLGDVGQYAIFAVFILYVIGFLIWRSYLSSYGISSIGFLQIEYISAAICYLFIASAFAFAPGILFARFLAEKRGEKENDSFVSVLVIWSVLFFWVCLIFFPISRPKPPDFWAAGAAALVAVAYIVLYVTYSIKKPTNTFGRFIKNDKTFNAVVFLFLVAGYGLFFVVHNDSLSIVFLQSSLFLYLIASYIAGKHISKHWIGSHITTKILLVTIASLAVLSNARQFGSLQFGHIQKSLGGGKPELAFVKFSEQGKDLGSSLGLPLVTNATWLNGFWGPVSILFKTDSEIVLVNPVEAGMEEFLGYSVANGKTTYNKPGDSTIYLGQLVSPTATNAVLWTNAEGLVNVGNGVIGGYVANPLNPVKVTGKQIRLELIDVIIYAKSTDPFGGNK